MIFDEINEVAKRVREQLPGFATLPTAHLKGNLRALVESALAQLNLVTREEFDAQAALLARTREKLDQLEALLAELEKRE